MGEGRRGALPSTRSSATPGDTIPQRLLPALPAGLGEALAGQPHRHMRSETSRLEQDALSCWDAQLGPRTRLSTSGGEGVLPPERMNEGGPSGGCWWESKGHLLTTPPTNQPGCGRSPDWGAEGKALGDPTGPPLV